MVCRVITQREAEDKDEPFSCACSSSAADRSIEGGVVQNRTTSFKVKVQELLVWRELQRACSGR